MRGRALAWLAATLAVLASACAGRMPASFLAPRVQHHGFSAARPPNDAWYANRHEQSPTSLMFRRATPGASHGFFFAVDLVTLPPGRGGQRELEEVVGERVREVSGSGRYELVSHAVEPALRQGQRCARYRIESIDRRNPRFEGAELWLLVRGEVCRHPLWPEAVLDIRHSERGLWEELDPRLREEGELLLRGVVIETAPGVPAGLPTHGSMAKIFPLLTTSRSSREIRFPRIGVRHLRTSERDLPSVSTG